MKKIFYFLLVLLSSCGKQDSHSVQVARMNIHTEPPSLDPRKATDVTSISIIKMCFEGLMRLGENSTPECALASSYQVSPDGLVYTFYLRDARWSDGRPITAHDFKESWKTILSPGFPSEFAYELYCLKNARLIKEGAVSIDQLGVRAINPKTLSITLEHPYPHFLMMLTSHAFLAVPSHVQEKFPQWAESPDHYVGSGPFKLKRWQHYYQIVLEKNPHYWDAPVVKLDTIELPIIDSETTGLALFDRNELDWVGSPLSLLPTDALATLRQTENVHLLPISGVYYFIFNTKEFPFHNVKIRRAFALALDRASLIKNVTQADETPALALIPPTMWDKHQAWFQDADTEEAQRLFEEGLLELGLTRKTFPPLRLSFNTLSLHHKIAQAVEQEWARILGVRVTLENKEWKVFLSELGKKQFQIARMGGIASINDAADFLENFRYDPAPKNPSGWHNEVFSALLAEADQTKDENKRKNILAQAEKILMEEMPIIPLYFYTSSYLKKPHLKGVALSPIHELDMKYAYIDTNELYN